MNACWNFLLVHIFVGLLHLPINWEMGIVLQILQRFNVNGDRCDTEKKPVGTWGTGSIQHSTLEQYISLKFIACNSDFKISVVNNM